MGANIGLDVFRITTPHFGSQTMGTESVLITDITELYGLVISLVSILSFSSFIMRHLWVSHATQF